MPIERIGKYLETSDLGFTHSLGIETNRKEACIREVQERRILGVFGCPVFGFKQDNLDFLREIPFIEQVWFWEVALKNVDGLYSLDDLSYFGIHEKRPAIDFSKFKNLRKAVWYPVRKDCGFGDLNSLQSLDVWRFKPKDKSYASIELPKSLKQLDFNWCNPASLEGMPTLSELEELQIHYCRNLESINSIFEFAPNLKRLVVTRCANLKDFDVISGHDWEHIYINIKGKTVANKSKRSDGVNAAGV
ncbi:hypothetical protein FKG94_20900 [Exilibacterium tricleocarpae]|uniref:Leucine-rich repeat domain-containing protein n=1 Tax=Exilibacterium tricleocarpae TaxID=2591008 RepID=A0A545T0Q3_9GAMM|nr:hypothetical protein [Exilibacterium tricleocarpae]TQV70786.1 hypothetical protein FKG94_20900 [Exilibacterium tricleocarpae]